MSQEIVKNKAVTIHNSLSTGHLFHDHINYEDCDFLSSEPTGVEFKGCNFTASEFYTLYLDDNKFINCVFTKCEFTQPIWCSVQFVNCWFIECNIENDYDMDDVRFYDCAFMRTRFADKVEQSHDDKLFFGKCSFTKTIFNNYCLDGTIFKNSTLKETAISNCSMKNAEIINTDLVGCKLNGLYISCNKWNSVRFKKCSWNNLTFYSSNGFSNVVLMDTTTENCKGDVDSLSKLIVSPYCDSSVVPSSSSALNSAGPLPKQPSTPMPAQPKQSKAPCRYISEGL